jgi:hypothetical protein
MDNSMNIIPQKAPSHSLRNLFRRDRHSKREKSKGTKDGVPQDGPAVASPAVSATPSESTVGSFVARIDACQPAQSSPVPVSMELRSPEQVASSLGSASSVQPVTTRSTEHPPLAPPIAPPTTTTSRAQAAPPTTEDPTTPSGPEQLWDQAYDDLQADEPKLLVLYKAILFRELGDSPKEAKGDVIEQADWAKRRSQMDCLLKTGLDKTKKLANVEKNIGDAINIVLSVENAIGSALQPVPIAALAWTGVCVALQASFSTPGSSAGSHRFIDICEPN